MEEINNIIQGWVLKERPLWFHLTLSIVTLGVWALLYFWIKILNRIPTPKWKQIIFAKVFINEAEKKIKINNKVYNYKDIIDYELLEDDESLIKSSTSSAIGRAVVGGVLTGGVGAVIGGTTGKKKTSNICSKLEIKITINNINNPVQYVKFITKSTKKTSGEYKKSYDNAQRLMSILNIINQNSNREDA